VAKAANVFRAAGLEVLRDIEFLTPGARWADVITEKLLTSDALVFFVSQASKSSSWMAHELVTFQISTGRMIFPILLPPLDYSDLPPELSGVQAVRLEVADDDELSRAAQLIAGALTTVAAPPVASDETTQSARNFAVDIAESIRAARSPDVVNRSGIFLVHGHDLSFRDEVREFLRQFGVEPVVLSQVRSRSRTLLDRFETVALQADFAVILLSSDDIGAARSIFEDSSYGGQQTLRFRTRQNVLLELGFFYGRLGWEKVAIIQKRSPRPWPEFELPSDLAGTVFMELDGAMDWREELVSQLRDAGVLPVDDSADS
jgi:predicted nucleotide-binding protein